MWVDDLQLKYATRSGDPKTIDLAQIHRIAILSEVPLLASSEHLRAKHAWVALFSHRGYLPALTGATGVCAVHAQRAVVYLSRRGEGELRHVDHRIAAVHEHGARLLCAALEHIQTLE